MITTDNALNVVITIIVSYLLGSIPTAYLLAKAKNVNIFEVGSGNMGGTNITRTLGLRYGILTGLIDMSKGVLAIWLARTIFLPDFLGTGTTISAIVVIIGHNWSLFATLLTATVKNGKVVATFKGGKGAATAFGTLLWIAPWTILAAMIAIAGFIIARTRYVSLGVLVSFGVAQIWLVILVAQGLLPSEVVLYSGTLTIMMAWRFRDNIYRLRTGTERRFGEKVQLEPTTTT